MLVFSFSPHIFRFRIYICKNRNLIYLLKLIFLTYGQILIERGKRGFTQIKTTKIRGDQRYPRHQRFIFVEFWTV